MQNPVVPVPKMRPSVGAGYPGNLDGLQTCYCDSLWLIKTPNLMSQVTFSSPVFLWRLHLAGAKMPVMFEVSEGRRPLANTLSSFGTLSLNPINDSFLRSSPSPDFKS